MFYNVISMFRRFCNALVVSGVACVNAGYFPRFMGSGDKPVPPLRQLFWRHLRRHGLGIWRAMLSGVCDVCSP